MTAEGAKLILQVLEKFRTIPLVELDLSVSPVQFFCKKFRTCSIIKSLFNCIPKGLNIKRRTLD